MCFLLISSPFLSPLLSVANPTVPPYQRDGSSPPATLHSDFNTRQGGVHGGGGQH